MNYAAQGKLLISEKGSTHRPESTIPLDKLSIMQNHSRDSPIVGEILSRPKVA